MIRDINATICPYGNADCGWSYRHAGWLYCIAPHENSPDYCPCYDPEIVLGKFERVLTKPSK